MLMHHAHGTECFMAKQGSSIVAQQGRCDFRFYSAKDGTYSPEEQISSMQNLSQNGPQASTTSKKSLFLTTLPGGWRLYGKTGNGTLVSSDSQSGQAWQMGWFAGWAEKENETIAFVQYLEDKHRMPLVTSKKAELIAKEKLIELIQHQ